MIISVDRYLSTNEATLSKISVDGQFFCYGVEDEYRAVKVPGETRIPAGSYKVTLRTWGGFHERYSKSRRFRSFHEGMLWVRDVPGFEDILIHVGNSERDTAGCLCVGLGRDETKMIVTNSTEAYIRLYQKVLPAARTNMLYINYEDKDL